jgi:hypothetical protein
VDRVDIPHYVELLDGILVTPRIWLTTGFFGYNVAGGGYEALLLLTPCLIIE